MDTKEVIWFIYLVECSDGTLYCGITNDLEKRLKKHNNGTGAKYTRGRSPIVLKYVETALTKSDALKREHAIKKLTKKKKWELIKGE